MNTNGFEACTSYMTCGMILHIQEINWTTVGAVVLLIARLVKDVPNAYDAIRSRIEKNKQNKENK